MRATETVQINLRIPAEVAEELDVLAEHEHASRADLARQILLDGLAQQKRAVALRLYREGQASKSRAAEIAGISLWEMLDIIDQAAVPNPYTLQEAVEEVRRLIQQFVSSTHS